MKRILAAVIHPQPRIGGDSENKVLRIMETLRETLCVSFVAKGDIPLEEPIDTCVILPGLKAGEDHDTGVNHI
jgi:hypothetical protein